MDIFPDAVAGLLLIEPAHEDVGKELFAVDPQSHVRNRQYLADLKRCQQADPSTLGTDKTLNTLCVVKTSSRFSESIRVIDDARALSRTRISAWISEMTHIWTLSADQVRKARRLLGDTPVLVLTKKPSAPAPGETVALRRTKNRILAAQHAATVALSTHGQQMEVEESGHYIQLDQPEIVIKAVIQMLGDHR